MNCELALTSKTYLHEETLNLYLTILRRNKNDQLTLPESQLYSYCMDG